MKRDTVHDPVCGMRLSRGDAAASAVWAGQRYYFCSRACIQRFEADTARYVSIAAHDSVRIPLVGLACIAGDALPVERALKSLPGVLDAYVNPADDAAHLTIDRRRFRMEDAVAEIERFGAHAVVLEDAAGTA